jgi:hypothetical protein
LSYQNGEWKPPQDDVTSHVLFHIQRLWLNNISRIKSPDLCKVKKKLPKLYFSAKPHCSDNVRWAKKPDTFFPYTFHPIRDHSWGSDFGYAFEEENLDAPH